MVRCTRIIEIIEEENLIENCAKAGKKLLDRFYALEKKFPGKISDNKNAHELKDNLQIQEEEECSVLLIYQALN